MTKSAPIQFPMTDGRSTGDACPFVLASERDALVAAGVADRLPDGAADRLVERVDAHFAARRHRRDSPLLVGALPFRRDDAAHLYEPRDVIRWRGVSRHQSPWDALPMPLALPSPRHWSVASEPSAAEYARRVARALAMMREAPALRKIVLARSLIATADRPIDPIAVLHRLYADRGVTTFAVPLPADADGARTLVGATPELLLEKRGATVTSIPLAGSARRSIGSGDRDVADALVRSDKDRREHAVVVEWIADRLAPYCRHLDVPARPQALSTQTMWHLATRIRGTLRDPRHSSLDLLRVLHPTPAVCGVPEAQATAAIDALEPFDRGFFAGAVGWCDASGDGRWLLAIRCAEIAGSTARLYAGAGIVDGSDPNVEAAETSAKFSAFLRALGIDEQGRPIDEGAS
jgi:isochorismate synthase